jgi:hypothetical protein
VAATDAVVVVAPCRHAGNVILVGVETPPLGHAGADHGLDGLLLDMLQHPHHHLAAALDQAENRRLLFGQGATPASPLQSATPAFAPFFRGDAAAGLSPRSGSVQQSSMSWRRHARNHWN